MTKMLLIDDDPAWRALYRMGFEGDFEVFEAVDGLDALAALDRVRPDIIVLDLRMPHLDGMGFLRQMERRGSKYASSASSLSRTCWVRYSMSVHFRVLDG